MTLTQLRYLLAVAKFSSFKKAAEAIYTSQPSLSKSISNLEEEMGIKIFVRHPNGVELTEEGFKFLSYANQVVEQADLLLAKYKKEHTIKRIFSVSAHHYAFVVNAFVTLVKEYPADEYEFSLRESRTADIIDDVKYARSEIGVIYLSNFNKEVLKNILKSNHLTYTSLFVAKPHVFVSRKHPLALKFLSQFSESKQFKLTLDDLLPFPRFTYDQGTNNSFYFAEELHYSLNVPKNIVVTDRATLFNLLIGLDGYTIASGILSSDLNGDQIIAIPLDSEEQMELIAITLKDHNLSPLCLRYLEILRNYMYSCKTD